MAKLQSVVNKNGQVTIPAELRRGLGLKQGDRVTIVRDGTVIRVIPIRDIVSQPAEAINERRHDTLPPLDGS